MRSLLGSFIIVVASIVAWSSGTALDREITFAAMYNLSGGQQNLDLPSSEGARLAVSQINKSGGVLGRPLRMTLVDGKTKPDVIARETKGLFKDREQPDALIGFSDTDMVLAAAPIAAKHKRVFLTSGATSPKLPAMVPEYLFLACFGDNVQAAAAAEWASRELKARTAVVLYNDSSTYTRLLHVYFEERFRQLGGKILKSLPFTPRDLKNKTADLPQADLVYLSALPDDVAVAVPALRDAGVGVPIVGGDGLDIGPAWAEVLRADKVYFTTHAYVGADNPDPIVRKFRDAFEKAYPGKEPDAFTALGFDTVRLLAHAIREAGGADPEAIHKSLAATKDFKGVTGTISFLNGSRIPDKSVTIMGVDKGRQSFIGSVLPAKVPPP